MSIGAPTPSSFDRGLDSRFGVAAVEMVARGEYGHMACLNCNFIQSTPIESAVGVLKTVDAKNELVRTARGLGFFFGD